jgi:hypothetical protein
LLVEVIDAAILRRTVYARRVGGTTTESRRHPKDVPHRRRPEGKKPFKKGKPAPERHGKKNTRPEKKRPEGKGKKGRRR